MRWAKFILLIACMPCAALAQDVTARIANINQAAAEIAVLQKQKGADGAFAAIEECYRREFATAKSFSPGVEACVVQDLIVSKVSAAFYGRQTPEVRKMAGAPEPGEVMNAMIKRTIGAFRRFSVPEQEARNLNQLVEKHGMDAYGRTMFPGQYPEKKN